MRIMTKIAMSDVFDLDKIDKLPNFENDGYTIYLYLPLVFKKVELDVLRNKTVEDILCELGKKIQTKLEGIK